MAANTPFGHHIIPRIFGGEPLPKEGEPSTEAREGGEDPAGEAAMDKGSFDSVIAALDTQHTGILIFFHAIGTWRESRR